MSGTEQQLDPHAVEQIRQEVANLINTGANWETFYRRTLGLHGVVRRRFADHDQMTQFEQTDLYSEIQQTLTRLRKSPRSGSDGSEPTKVITVRLPSSLHEAIRAEAYANQTSMNQLCISKLMQHIDTNFVPDAFQEREGRPIEDSRVVDQ